MNIELIADIIMWAVIPVGILAILWLGISEAPEDEIQDAIKKNKAETFEKGAKK